MQDTLTYFKILSGYHHITDQDSLYHGEDGYGFSKSYHSHWWLDGKNDNCQTYKPLFGKCNLEIFSRVISIDSLEWDGGQALIVLFCNQFLDKDQNVSEPVYIASALENSTVEILENGAELTHWSVKKKYLLTNLSPVFTS